jgi:hypothetical protein
MKEIYKIMKNYADKNMCACGNCGADFYFEGRRESRKCPVCGYECSEESDNLDDFQECNLVDFFDYVVESVQHFDNKYTKFTMHGKTVTIDFKSSTMTCEDESGNIESCEVDVWILIALCDVFTFRENARIRRENEMKCPNCDKGDLDAHELDLDYREFWYDDRVELVRNYHCQYCNKVIIMKETYRLVSRRFLGIRE